MDTCTSTGLETEIDGFVNVPDIGAVVPVDSFDELNDFEIQVQPTRKSIFQESAYDVYLRLMYADLAQYVFFAECFGYSSSRPYGYLLPSSILVALKFLMRGYEVPKALFNSITDEYESLIKELEKIDLCYKNRDRDADARLARFLLRGPRVKPRVEPRFPPRVGLVEKKTTSRGRRTSVKRRATLKMN